MRFLVAEGLYIWLLAPFFEAIMQNSPYRYEMIGVLWGYLSQVEVTTAGSVQTPEQSRTHLDAHRLWPTRRDADIAALHSWKNGMTGVLFIDAELTSFHILEIAVLDHKGDLVIDQYSNPPKKLPQHARDVSMIPCFEIDSNH